MKKFLRVNDVALQLGVSPSAVRKYVKQEKLTCKYTPGGQRYFSQEDVNTFLGITLEETAVFYVRSSSGNKNSLENQIKQLTEHATPLKVYKEKASGLNENRPQLLKLLQDAENKQFNTVYITEKDRLTRFGYKYLELLLLKDNIKIKYLKETDQTDIHKELMQDFMNLIASFSGRFYQLRGREQKLKLLNKASEEVKK